MMVESVAVEQLGLARERVEWHAFLEWMLQRPALTRASRCLDLREFMQTCYANSGHWSCHAVLAETMHADFSWPAQPTSAMDGIGVASQVDLTRPIAVLPITDGNMSKTPMSPNEAIAVHTGMALPDWVGRVIPIEAVDEWPQNECQHPCYRVIVDHGMLHKSHIKAVGSDFNAGDVLLEAGLVLSAPRRALLASARVTHCPVFEPIHLQVFNTGSELQAYDSLPGSMDQSNPSNFDLTVDVNRLLLQETLSSLPLAPWHMTLMADETAVFLSHLDSALADNCDVILTTGASSVGQKDQLIHWLQHHPNYVLLRQVALNIKPAKPFIYAELMRADGNVCHLLGLPGNPVATMVSMQLLALPFLKRLAGWEQPKPKWLRLTLDAAFENKKSHWLFVLADVVAGDVMPLFLDSMSQINRLSQAKGLIRVPPHRVIQPGDMVDFLPFVRMSC